MRAPGFPMNVAGTGLGIHQPYRRAALSFLLRALSTSDGVFPAPQASEAEPGLPVPQFKRPKEKEAAKAGSWAPAPGLWQRPGMAVTHGAAPLPPPRARSLEHRSCPGEPPQVWSWRLQLGHLVHLLLLPCKYPFPCGTMRGLSQMHGYGTGQAQRSVPSLMSSTRAPCCSPGLAATHTTGFGWAVKASAPHKPMT